MADNDNGEGGGGRSAATENNSATYALLFKLPHRLFQNNISKKIVLKCIDCHAGGEPARIVLSGVPAFPPGYSTALQKRSYMMDHLDHLRKILLLEPRGYPCQNADYVFPAETGSSNNLQYVIAEQNKIYPLMSGHNTICVATALLECGVVKMEEPVSKFTLEAPAGPIEITAKCHQGKAQSISFRNAPSFVEHLGVAVNVPHDDDNIGPVTLDIAYGGMWYAIVDMDQFEQKDSRIQLKLDPSYGKLLCKYGEMIKVACREQFPVQHPTEDYPGVDILAFRSGNRNAVIMSNNTLDWDKPETWTAMIDRSPCGTGTCAIMAMLHAKGLLKLGEPFVHESIVGSKFTGRILEETTLEDGRKAIIPQVEGSACITQYSEIVVDPEDPFSEGFRVADIW
eukprot:scaffold2533_cov137-Cylindrotheca_fusiformis.AAC.2